MPTSSDYYRFLSALTFLNMEEVWKKIDDYDGLYEVSNLSRVRSLKFNKTKILSQINCNGYKNVILCKGGKNKVKGVHRLLAISFIPNPMSKADVNHINGIKSDNRVENLEWATRKENIQHSFKFLDRKILRGQDANGSIYSNQEVYNILTDINKLDGKINLAKYCREKNYNYNSVYAIYKKQTWTHIKINN